MRTEDLIEAVEIDKLESEFEDAVCECTSDEELAEKMRDVFYLALDRVETFMFHNSWEFTKDVLVGAMICAKVDNTTIETVKTAINKVDPNEVVRNE